MAFNLYKETGTYRNPTLAQVETLLGCNTYVGQRKVNNETVRYYAELMLKGLFRPVTVTLMRGPDKVEQLANAQHCLLAMLLNGRAHPLRVDIYDCDTEADKATLFSTFDGQKKRTDAQHIHSRKHCFPAYIRENADKFLSSVGSALYYTRNGGLSLVSTLRNREGDGADYKALGIERADSDTMKFLIRCKLWAGSDRDRLLTVMPLCAMINTWRANKACAERFWKAACSGAASETEISKLKIPLNLGNEIQAKIADVDALKKKAGSMISQSGRSKLPYMYFILAWNRWMGGGDTLSRLTRHFSDTLPEPTGEFKRTDLKV